MLFQGIFRILDLYFEEELLSYYDKIDRYLRKSVISLLSDDNLKEIEILHILADIINVLTHELINFGIDPEYLSNKFQELYFESQYRENVQTSLDLFNLKIIPLLNEIFLEILIFYIGGINGSKTILKLKNLKLIPLDLFLNLNKLKEDLSASEKIEHFQKYIGLIDSVCGKFCENKINIERLEDIEKIEIKLQLMYLLYRIIDFFNLQNNFNFTHIRTFIKNNLNKWLIRTPIVTLTSPEIYYCGIFMANELNINLDQEKIQNFLDEIYDSIIEETYTPLIEETDQIYYFLKACEIVYDYIEPSFVEELIKEEEEEFYAIDNLKLMETSKLAVIIKIYALLNLPEKLEIKNIERILSVIHERINKNGVKQFPNGPLSSEATYYTLFIHYMRDSLKILENTNYLESIIQKIYTNLMFLKFTEDVNFDLVSEIFYSCESLKLLNCIETKETLVQLSKYLFPDYITNKIARIGTLPKNNIKYRYFKIDKKTGRSKEII
ncbi:MAG: hypothetical protein KAX10_04420 [Candidatus Lokiarchaeota archaeon]|nr:hypothetical protein [Candidatus Lokiarchaeota archaeon]